MIEQYKWEGSRTTLHRYTYSIVSYTKLTQQTQHGEVSVVKQTLEVYSSVYLGAHHRKCTSQVESLRILGLEKWQIDHIWRQVVPLHAWIIRVLHRM